MLLILMEEISTDKSEQLLTEVLCYLHTYVWGIPNGVDLLLQGDEVQLKSTLTSAKAGMGTRISISLYD